jgi:hypothetical protein
VPEGKIGQQFIPNLCIICHGGVPGYRMGGDPGTRNIYQFIPFDVANFTFAGAAGPTKAQMDSFMAMNTAIKPAINPARQVNTWLTDLLKGNNPSFVATSPLNPALPQSAAYNISCRSCHSTHSAARDVAGADDQMPHSLRTWATFWGSSAATQIPVADQGATGVKYLFDQPNAAAIIVGY